MAAARKGDTLILEALLDAGSDLDAVDSDGWTALRYATEFKNAPAADLLTQRGAK
jgi:ankyrin repeat protein